MAPQTYFLNKGSNKITKLLLKKVQKSNPVIYKNYKQQNKKILAWCKYVAL